MVDASLIRPERDAHAARRTSQRVALFTGAYNHIADGVSLTLNRLVRHLEQRGAEVRVFAPTVDDPPVDHAGTLVPVPSVSAPGRAEYRVALGLTPTARRALDAFEPTLVHVATPDLLGRSARRYALRHDLPLVASYHTHFSSYLKYYNLSVMEGAMWRYLRWFYGACEHVYVPSESMACVLREQGITQGLRLWERGVETDRFDPARRSEAWRHAAGIEPGEVLVTFVGRLVWEKGLDVYADVIEALQARGIPHRSMIVGDGPARADLEARLTETVFTGYLGGEGLARAYASSDVFLFPSDTETFGNVTLEAMASGVPTVCADATGSNMLVEHGATGLLAPAGDRGAFLAHVEHLVTDDAARAVMGRAARRRARRYEWDAVLGRIAGYYDELLDTHRVEAAPAGDGAHRGDGLCTEQPPVLAHVK